MQGIKIRLPRRSAGDELIDANLSTSKGDRSWSTVTKEVDCGVNTRECVGENLFKVHTGLDHEVIDLPVHLTKQKIKMLDAGVCNHQTPFPGERQSHLGFAEHRNVENYGILVLPEFGQNRLTMHEGPPGIMYLVEVGTLI
jgi:hypothetical protein